MRTQLGSNAVKNQSGAVLVVSLVVLLLLTIIVMSANRGVVLQERMTSALRETNLVFQSAETALVEAETFIETLSVASLASFANDGTNGLYAENYGPADYTASAVWQSGKYRAGSDVMNGYSSQYFIESLGEYTLAEVATDISLNNDYNQPDVEPIANVFRIVVRAVGPNGVTERIIAGYYSKTL